jgi:hypothetical protein
MEDLGNPNASPVNQAEYERLRAQSVADSAARKAAA